MHTVSRAEGPLPSPSRGGRWVRWHSLNTGLALLALATVLASPVRALDPGTIETHTLDNGLKVVLWPDHSIPNIAMYNFFRVGSRNEVPGITGLSHFFEHMMFLGSRNYAPGEFDEVMEAAGGANNAFTAQDITVYQDWFPTSATETIFTLEADRIGWLAIDSTTVESERQVVASERRRSVDDNNIRALDEQNWAAAYMAHPYQWPVIGWMVDIEHWKIEDLQKYFRIYYAPNNATLCIVGDFEPARMLRLADEYLGNIPRGPEPKPVTTMEPLQNGERRTELIRQAQLAAVLSSWHVPAAKDDDYFALVVLEGLLLRGDSSRLHQRLVEQDELALRVFGGFDQALDPTLFQIYMQVRQGVDPARCEAALYEELDRLRNNPPNAREMRKAKNQLAANFYRRLATIGGKAISLGFSDVYFGDPTAFLGSVERYEEVTPEDIQRVVRTYFTKRNRTVSILVPESEEDQAQADPADADTQLAEVTP
jgi:zinc protease